MTPVAGPTARALARLYLLPGLLYLVGYVALTWPAVLSFRTHYFGDANDTLQNVWNIWWMHIALVVKHGSPYFTDQLFYPVGAPLIGHTLNPLNGLLAIGLNKVFSTYTTYNLLTVFAFVVGGMTAFALAWHLSRSWAGSLFAGAVFTFSHFHFAHARGHMQLVSLQFIPLFVLLFWNLLEKPTLARGVGSGLALILVMLCDWYYVFYCVLTGVVLFGHRVWVTRSPLLLFRESYRGAFAAFLALVVPPMATFGYALMGLHARDPLHASHDPAEFGADLLACFLPGGSWRFADWSKDYCSKVRGGPCEASMYLGLTVLAVAFFARKHAARLMPHTRLWLRLALLFWLLSLGPVLNVVGQQLAFIPMPYQLLELLVPPLSLSGCPSRMNVMVTLFVGVACAGALVPFLREVLRWRALQALFLAVCVFEYLPWEQALTRIERPDYIAALDKLPPGAVHVAGHENLPYELILQTMHRRQIPCGYISRYPATLWQRQGHVQGLLAQHHYAELLAAYSVRYLVLPNEVTAAEAECVALFRGKEQTIWVAKTDPLAPASSVDPDAMSYRIEQAANGILLLRIHSRRHAGQRFACLFSRTRAEPGTSLSGIPLPVAIDDELLLSLDPDNKVYVGSIGSFDASGDAVVGLDRRVLQQRGAKELWFAWYTFAMGNPPRIERPAPIGTVRLE